MTKTLPRGIRNNNPGNIDYSDYNKWVGKLPRDTDIEPRFERFDSPVNGIRALALLIQTYQDRYGLRTVRAIIGKWAPENENKTSAYVAAVAASLRVDPDADIDVQDYRTARPLVLAIIRHENGQQPYTDTVIDEGLRRAGVTSGQSAAPVKTATIATASTVAAPGIGLATLASDPTLRAAVQETGISWLIIAVGIIGVAATSYLLWHSLRKRQADAAS